MESKYLITILSTQKVLMAHSKLKDGLLHERDGLALWDANRIDMEALSNDAIILSIELPI